MIASSDADLSNVEQNHRRQDVASTERIYIDHSAHEEETAFVPIVFEYHCRANCSEQSQRCLEQSE